MPPMVTASFPADLVPAQSRLKKAGLAPTFFGHNQEVQA